MTGTETDMSLFLNKIKILQHGDNLRTREKLTSPQIIITIKNFKEKKKSNVKNLFSTPSLLKSIKSDNRTDMSGGSRSRTTLLSHSELIF